MDPLSMFLFQRLFLDFSQFVSQVVVLWVLFHISFQTSIFCLEIFSNFAKDLLPPSKTNPNLKIRRLNSKRRLRSMSSNSSNYEKKRKLQRLKRKNLNLKRS